MVKKNSLKLNKKAVSSVIAYILLLGLALSMSGAIYAWMKFYTKPVNYGECPEGVAISISSIEYEDLAYSLNITLKNRGLYTIEGYIIKGSTNENGVSMKPIFFIFSENPEGDVWIEPGKEKTIQFNQNNETMSGYIFEEFREEVLLGPIKLIEVQPLKTIDGNFSYCDAIVRKKI